MNNSIPVEIFSICPQTPFNFSIIKKIKVVELSEKVVKKWKAGQKIEIDGTLYTVAKEILPEPGRTTLYGEV